MVIKEDVVDTSIFEEAYYEDPELQIKREMEEFYGNLPILRSSSNDFYWIDPDTVYFYYNKLQNFSNNLEKTEHSACIKHVTSGDEMSWESWKKNTFSFIKHLEEIGIIAGPLKAYRKTRVLDSDTYDEMHSSSLAAHGLEVSDIKAPSIETIENVCEMSAINEDRLRIFKDALLTFLFSLDDGSAIGGEFITENISSEDIQPEFDEDSDSHNGIYRTEYYDLSGKNIRAGRYKLLPESTNSKRSSKLMSGLVFEKIL